MVLHERVSTSVDPKCQGSQTQGPRFYRWSASASSET